MNIFCFLMGWLRVYQGLTVKQYAEWMMARGISAGIERDGKNSIIDIYTQILKYHIAPLVDIKEAHFQRRAGSDVASHRLRKSTQFPQIFSPNYDFIVPYDRQPAIEPLSGRQMLTASSSAAA